jgi:transposase
VLVCSGCGRRVHGIAAVYEREVRDLPRFEYRTTVVIELYRVKCPDCGLKEALVLPLRRAMRRYLQKWIDQLRRQRPFEKLARMLLDHLDGILNYCRTKVLLGVIEAVNGNIKALLRRGRGYKNLRYLLLKAQRLAATRTQFLVVQKAA